MLLKVMCKTLPIYQFTSALTLKVETVLEAMPVSGPTETRIDEKMLEINQRIVVVYVDI